MLREIAVVVIPMFIGEGLCLRFSISLLALIQQSFRAKASLDIDFNKHSTSNIDADAVLSHSINTNLTSLWVRSQLPMKATKILDNVLCYGI